MALWSRKGCSLSSYRALVDKVIDKRPVEDLSALSAKL